MRRGLVGAVALLAAGLIGYRTLRPGEIVDRAQTGYPASGPVAAPVVYGTLLGSPLLVDGRLRVYAGIHQVRADLPVDSTWTSSPFWSYRRWPAQLSGLVAMGTTVVTQWSDGDLVAIDATLGTVAWRVHADKPAHGGYTGRQTGWRTAHQPPDLYTDGGTVIVTGFDAVSGYDAATGRRRWRVAATCPDGFTGFGAFFCLGDTTTVYDTGDGSLLPWHGPAGPRPEACALGRSGCRAVRSGGRAFLLGPGGAATEAPALAAPGGWLCGGTVVRVGADGTVTGVSVTDGRLLWTWSDPRGSVGPRGRVATVARVIAVEPGAVHLLTTDRWIVTLDPAVGTLLSWYPLAPRRSGPFDLGEVYAADRYLFIERIMPGAVPSDDDSAYYYPPPNVVIAGS